jgi:hypothetical protein
MALVAAVGPGGSKTRNPRRNRRVEGGQGWIEARCTRKGIVAASQADLDGARLLRRVTVEVRFCFSTLARARERVKC